MIARVAFLVQDLDALGGSERQANALAAALAQRQIEVTILTTTGPGLLDRPRQGWSEMRGAVQVYRVPLLAFEDAAGLYLSAARVDVIYAVGIMMGSIGARLAELTGAELAVKLACSGEWGDMAWLAQLPAPQRREVHGELARATLVAISEDTAREAREAGFAPERLARIPNGVAAPPPIERTEPEASAPIVLFAGRLDRQKGLDLLIEAFAAVETPGARLWVAGDGPERGTLEALAAALGQTDRVSFLGRRDDVAALMASVTVVCLPSRGEGISNTLLEALALGVPVVASAIPANVEVIEGGQDACGVTVAPEDPAALARALDQVLADADLRGRLGAAGRRRVAERYALSVVADRYVALFARLARARDPHPGPVRLLGRLTRARTGQVRRALRRVLRSGQA